MDKAALALGIVGVVFGGGAWIALMVVFHLLGRRKDR